MFKQHQYRFKWKDLGDIKTGRPNLGETTPVAVYRLMQFTLRDTANQLFGIEQTNRLFYAAGKLAGTEFCNNELDIQAPFPDFVAELQKKLRTLRIGILRFEETDLDTMQFVLTVEEDLDCSGLEASGETVCEYDEGFICGVLTAYSGKSFVVKEIDCWSSGGRVCRFTAEIQRNSQ